MVTRRNLLLSTTGALTILGQTTGRAASIEEVEKLLRQDRIGGRLAVEDLPTPALVVDLDAFEANVAKMAAFLRGVKRDLRPHGKTHKCPAIARRLIDAGAVGACTAKLSEAEAFAREGVTGLLITTAVVGRYKTARAARLAKAHPDTIFCADDPGNVDDLDEAARACNIRMRVAVDLYVGGRTGVAPGEAALALVQRIESKKNLRFAGIQAYCGPASHHQGFSARRAYSHQAMAAAVETRRLLERSGIACPLLTGGSTGTYNIDTEIDGLTELQPGSYIFMDIDYNRIGGQDGPLYRDFRNSLFVITTVVSRPEPHIAIVDGGLKAFATDRPFAPEPYERGGIQYSWAGDEHGRLTLSGDARALRVGDRLTMVVPHCDPTVNLYDRLYGMRKGRVELAWRISARGMSQ